MIKIFTLYAVLLDWVKTNRVGLILLSFLLLTTGPSIYSNNGMGVVMGIIAWGVIVISSCISLMRWK